MATTARASRLLRTLQLVLAVAAALACVEVLMVTFDLPGRAQQWRFLGPELRLQDAFVSDDDLFWKLRPGAAGVDANELGLPGPLPPNPKRSGHVRIVCVGDSCTFGSGVRPEDNYPARLERSLQDRWPDRRVDVLRAALPGYSTWQSRRLLEQHLERLDPDYTVLYCGAWNDYVAAVGDSDRERAQASWLRRTRIAQMLASVTPGRHARDHEAVRAAFARGEAPRGRRVPLPDFEANLRAMIALLRGHGAGVCLLAPPAPATTRSAHPVTADYHATVVRLAGELQVDFVDGFALLADAEVALGGASPAPADVSVCFHDWVHPSATGHRVLAGALLPLVARAVRPSVSTEPPPRDVRLDVESVPALGGGSFSVLGSGLTAVERVRVGERILPVRHEPERLRIEVPPLFPPGVQEVVLLGGFGCRSAGVLAVAAPGLTATCTRNGGTGTLTLRGVGPPGWQVSVWLAPAVRSEPRVTPEGPFALAGDPEGWDASSLAPFSYARLPLPRVEATVSADGTFVATRELTAPEMGRLPAQWWAQGLLFAVSDSVRGCLTQCVRGTTAP